MIEFIIYERIIRGNLRPHLKEFSKSTGLKRIEAEFYTWKIDFDVKRTEDELISLFTDRLPDYQPGDFVRIKHDDLAKKFTISLKKNKREEELINIDIPPASNKKSAIFRRIIEDEFKRVKASIPKMIKNASAVKELSDYALINIQFLKSLSRDIFLLKKRLDIPEKDIFKDPDSYVIYVLKKFLIYSIREFQLAFEHIADIEIQKESELEDELFEGEHSRMQVKIKATSAKFNQIHLQRVYAEIDVDSSLELKVELLKNKLLKQNDTIASRFEKYHHYIPYEVQLRDLYEEELGKLLSKKYLTYIRTETNFKSRSEQVEQALLLVSNLKRDMTSLDFGSLKKLGFFEIANEEVETIKELLEISKSARVPDLLSDLIAAALTIQARKRFQFAEDDWNDFLTDLLRFKGYSISDQTRSGFSSNKNPSSTNSGELDIAVRNVENSGVIDTIIETLKINSCGKENKAIKIHIDKLLTRYDLNGNEVNYLLILSYAASFSDQWRQYKSYVNRKVFRNLNYTEDFLHTKFAKADLRVGITAFHREERPVKLFHIFVNMHE